MRDTLIRHKHHSHEISGRCHRGGQGGATVPEYNVHWICLWRLREWGIFKIEEDHTIKTVFRNQKKKVHDEIFPKLYIFN